MIDATTQTITAAEFEQMLADRGKWTVTTQEYDESCGWTCTHYELDPYEGDAEDYFNGVDSSCIGTSTVGVTAQCGDFVLESTYAISWRQEQCDGILHDRTEAVDNGYSCTHVIVDEDGEAWDEDRVTEAVDALLNFNYYLEAASPQTPTELELNEREPNDDEERFELEFDGQPTLVFTGELVAEDDDEGDLYRLEDDDYLLIKTGRWGATITRGDEELLDLFD